MGSFMTPSKKYQNFDPPLPFFPLSTNIQVWSKYTPLLDVLNWDSTPPSPQVILEFFSKTLTMRSTERADFLLLVRIVFTILICITKRTEKAIIFQQANFYERLMYLQCFYHRTTIQVQKTFQDENSVIEIQKV